jgi:hypothetical protein
MVNECINSRTICHLEVTRTEARLPDREDRYSTANVPGDFAAHPGITVATAARDGQWPRAIAYPGFARGCTTFFFRKRSCTCRSCS